MKTIKQLLYILLLSPSLLIAQEDEQLIHLEEEHKAQVFFEQNLTDFDHKIHSVIIASYKGFETITKESESTIDFQNGINESLSKRAIKSFTVKYETNQDELLAIALHKEIAERILKVCPKGFSLSTGGIDVGDILLIQFDDKNQDKASFQPLIRIILDYDSSSVIVEVNEPSKK